MVSVDETNKIVDEIQVLSQRKVMCDQSIMGGEIENFIRNNLVEMHKNIHELKDSLVKEAINMEETGFSHVAKKLYEEIDYETEELKSQYDAQRLIGIEKIKSKYVKVFK